MTDCSLVCEGFSLCACLNSWDRNMEMRVEHSSDTYISGVLDLFFPLKNSGRALRSMA